LTSLYFAPQFTKSTHHGIALAQLYAKE